MLQQVVAAIKESIDIQILQFSLKFADAELYG
jgi:hypothetical protein